MIYTLRCDKFDMRRPALHDKSLLLAVKRVGVALKITAKQFIQITATAYDVKTNTFNSFNSLKVVKLIVKLNY